MTACFILVYAGHPGPFTVHWTIDEAADVPGETYNSPKYEIGIHIPAPVIMARVTLTYPFGLHLSKTVNVPPSPIRMRHCRNSCANPGTSLTHQKSG